MILETYLRLQTEVPIIDLRSINLPQPRNDCTKPHFFPLIQKVGMHFFCDGFQ